VINPYLFGGGGAPFRPVFYGKIWASLLSQNFLWGNCDGIKKWAAVGALIIVSALLGYAAVEIASRVYQYSTIAGVLTEGVKAQLRAKGEPRSIFDPHIGYTSVPNLASSAMIWLSRSSGAQTPMVWSREASFRSRSLPACFYLVQVVRP
jgi:hypothetical protein